jgi:hypothetical protein
VVTTSGTKTYTLPVTMPGNKAQIEVTVEGRGNDFPSFQDGLVSTIPGDPTHHLRFYHRRTSGWPSMYIQRFSSTHLASANLTETDTITNTRHRRYDVRMVTAVPRSQRRHWRATRSSTAACNCRLTSRRDACSA